ncbi:MAG: zinc metalloprotease [Microbacterium sp.]|nr:zinc metalloprotease [Microbacterium sp.]
MTSKLPMAVFPASARPELGTRVSVDAPADAEGAWIIARDQVPRARISESVATVARHFTGERTVSEIAHQLGEPWTPDDVGAVARRLADAGLLRTDAQREEQDRPLDRGSRWRFRPPLTVQFNIGDPTRLFAAFRPITRVAVGAPGLVVFLAIVLAGFVVGLLSADDIVEVLEHPVPLPVVIGLSVAIVLTTVVHEVGHGAVLSHFGGSPRRIGAMLFYLAPAFFCDVTDGWRLGRRERRVAVALAGPAVHLLCAAASIVLARFFTDPMLHAALVLYGLSCLVITVLNLLPFVQLDGYLALMSALDHPHLRRHAMHAAGEMLCAMLFGTIKADRTSAVGGSGSTRRGWLVAYGVTCRLFPVVLVGLVLYRSSAMVAGLGVVPAIAYLLTVALVIAVAAAALIRGARALHGRRPDARRTAVSLGAIIAVAGAILFLVPIQPAHQVGFAVDGEDVRLVAGTSAELPAAGTAVTLESNGVVLRHPLGSATVGGGSAEHDDGVDLAALAPVSASGLTTPAWTTGLADVETAETLPPYGRATFSDSCATNIAAWLWQTFLARPAAALGSEHR